MIKLKELTMNKFDKEIYKYYKELFPAEEQKAKKLLRDTYRQGILKIIGIYYNDNLVGFMLTNTLPDNKYLQLDYLGIFPKYQGMGYGSKAIMELKNISKNYNGIFGEVEAEGLGENEEENEIRKRRQAFYNKLGFRKLEFKIELFKVIFTPMILDISENNNTDDIIESMFNIYVNVVGEEKANKYCKIIDK